MAGRSLQLRRLNLALPFPSLSHVAFLLRRYPPRTESLTTATLVTAADRRDSTGATYGGQGTWNWQKEIDLGPVIIAERLAIFLPAVPNPVPSRAQRIRRIVLLELRRLVLKLVESFCEYVKVICIKWR